MWVAAYVSYDFIPSYGKLPWQVLFFNSGMRMKGKKKSAAEIVQSVCFSNVIAWWRIVTEGRMGWELWRLFSLSPPLFLPAFFSPHPRPERLTVHRLLPGFVVRWNVLFHKISLSGNFFKPWDYLCDWQYQCRRGTMCRSVFTIACRTCLIFQQ